MQNPSQRPLKRPEEMWGTFPTCLFFLARWKRAPHFFRTLLQVADFRVIAEVQGVQRQRRTETRRAKYPVPMSRRHRFGLALRGHCTRGKVVVAQDGGHEDHPAAV